jgi:ATP-dependent 26S proteasome regulatory subunit
VIRMRVRSGGTDAAILFFDEADALFGKRTAVRDSHDRYAKLSSKSLAQDLRKTTDKKTIKGSRTKKKNAP